MDSEQSMGCTAIGFLDFTDLGGRLDVTLPAGDISPQTLDVLAKFLGIGGVLLNVSLEHVNLIRGIFDVLLLLSGGVVAEMLERCKLHLLIVLFFLPFSIMPFIISRAAAPRTAWTWRRSSLNLIRGIFDVLLLLSGGVVAEMLERCNLHLLIVLFFLALLHHAVHHLNHFLQAQEHQEPPPHHHRSARYLCRRAPS